MDDLKSQTHIKFHDKKLLKLHQKKESILNKNFNTGKVEYAIPKKLIPNVKTAIELFDGVSSFFIIFTLILNIYLYYIFY